MKLIKNIRDISFFKRSISEQDFARRDRRKNIEKGRAGEDIAKRYLHGKGYRIIDQNYRTPYAEIDIIAQHKGILTFIEVRTRQNEIFGSPEDTIKRKKVIKLIKNAKGYISRRSSNKKYRIDAICIVLDDNGKLKRLSHYKNITLDFNCT